MTGVPGTGDMHVRNGNGVAARCTFVSGDFTAGVPPAATSTSSRDRAPRAAAGRVPAERREGGRCIRLRHPTSTTSSRRCGRRGCSPRCPATSCGRSRTSSATGARTRASCCWRRARPRRLRVRHPRSGGATDRRARAHAAGPRRGVRGDLGAARRARQRRSRRAGAGRLHLARARARARLPRPPSGAVLRHAAGRGPAPARSGPLVLERREPDRGARLGARQLALAPGRAAARRAERHGTGARADGRAVRQAAIRVGGGRRRRRAAGLPRRHGELRGARSGGPDAGPAAHAHRLPPRRGEAEPHPLAQHGRLRQPGPGPRLEPGFRRREPGRPALRRDRLRDRR